jgi:hypothetical protein
VRVQRLRDADIETVESSSDGFVGEPELGGDVPDQPANFQEPLDRHPSAAGGREVLSEMRRLDSIDQLRGAEIDHLCIEALGGLVGQTRIENAHRFVSSRNSVAAWTIAPNSGESLLWIRRMSSRSSCT